MISLLWMKQWKIMNDTFLCGLVWFVCFLWLKYFPGLPSFIVQDFGSINRNDDFISTRLNFVYIFFYLLSNHHFAKVTDYVEFRNKQIVEIGK